MLPRALASTYGQYKRDTATVTTWLATTATSMGFRLTGGGTPTAAGAPSTTGGRLKGKARAEAKKKAASSAPSSKSSPARHIVNARDLVPMAKLVADNKTPVPAHVGTMLSSAIATRAGFASKLVQHGSSLDQRSNASHEFFLSLLIQVREHLQPHVQVTGASPDKTSRVNTQLPGLANRFDGLTVSEPSQQFLDAPNVTFTNPFEPDPTPRPPRAKGPKLAELLRSETNKLLRGGTELSESDFISKMMTADEFSDIDWEAEFAFCLVMGDLMTLRDRIRWVWANVKASRASLVEAAVTTDQAIELARSMIDEVMPLVDRNCGMHGTMCKAYLEQCIGNGINVQHIIDDSDEHPVHSMVFDDATYKIADRMFFNAWELLHTYLVCVPYSKEELHVYNDAKFAKFEPGCDHDASSFKEKRDQDRSLFSMLFTDLTAIVREVPGFPVRDTLLSSWETMDKTRDALFHAAFAIQVHLDIAYTMGVDISKGYNTLMSRVSEIEEDVQATLAFHKKHSLDSAKNQTAEMHHSILEMIQALRSDPVGGVVSRVKNGLGMRLSTADVKGHRLLRGSPVLSGLILLVIQSEYRHLSFSLADSHFSIQCGQHLYHALSIHRQRQGPLQGPSQHPKWPDMEILRKILSPDSFYTGGVLPSDLEQCFRLFSLQLGVSPISFSRDRRPNTTTRGKMGPRQLKRPAPVLSLFAKRYGEHQTKDSMTPELLERIIAQSRFRHLTEFKHRIGETGEVMATTIVMRPVDDEEVLREKARQATAFFGDGSASKAQLASTSASPGAPSSSGKAQTMLMYNPDGTPELVYSLYFSLQVEAMVFNFPILRMHRQCCEMMQHVRDSQAQKWQEGSRHG
ncbi:hypothetical protein Micbo1qcDRAFT_174586 [Microdochium bolleyi]|uniref:DUF6604 domain-containing protein n=1 Tax=Microdochium bolleyi TaxID=196109 RepID=A0A136J8V0_9PEZI|nr:hypothetical protein Micbo1qcDRAFT_174586 [Microdochium bolleyi]